MRLLILILPGLGGSIPDSSSKTLLLVALYAPVIDLRHSFCSIVSVVTGSVPFPRMSIGECHTEAPYVIAGRTTAEYTCLALFSVAPHVEAATLVRAIVCVAI